jgi:hypothetical protein
MKYGVPQGSILGPLLFLVFMNDLVSYVEDDSIVLFADDIFVFYIDKLNENVRKGLQSNFNKITDWFTINDLYLNEQKTVTLNVASPHNNKQPYSIFIHKNNCNLQNCNINCTKLVTVDSTKYLGFTVDQAWRHEEHIDNLIQKLRSTMHKLFQLKYILNVKNKLKIYDAWVISHITYGIEIYGFASEHLIKRLQRTQNKIVKMFFKGNDDLTTEMLFKKHKLFNITQLRDYTVIKNNFFVNNYKHVDQYKVEYLRDETIRFPLPLWKNEYGKRNKSYYIPLIFNKLPKEFKDVVSYNKLKTLYKTWIFAV